MSRKHTKKDTMAMPHRLLNNDVSDRKGGKKWIKTSHKHSGLELDSNLNALPRTKRNMVDSVERDSKNMYPSKKVKSFGSRDTPTISSKQRDANKNLEANSSSEVSSELDSNESDNEEELDFKAEGAYEPVSGTSRPFLGSAGETVSHDGDDDEGDDDGGDDDDDGDDGSLGDNDGDEERHVKDEGDDPGKESDEYAAIKKELANIPLEDLMKIKERLGLKVFNKIMHGHISDREKPVRTKKTFKRENKNRPREMSSRRPVSVVRHTDNLSQKHKFHRDPRFDDLSGEYKDEYFETNYSFLNEIKDKEKRLVKKKLKKTEDSEKKKDLQGLLMRMNQQKHVSEQKKKQKAIESTWKSKEKEMVKEGKLPYFLKKSEKKKLELAEKYKELQKSGKLEKYLTKKRKKNAQKERKKLPQQMN